MQNIHSNPILNTSLPAQFRRIRIELAREPGRPEGDADVAYVIVAPLDADDRIDPTLWRKHREACRMRSGFTSLKSVSYPANMSRSTKVVSCTPTASYR